MFETIKYGFDKGHPATGIFLDVNKTFDEVWFDRVLFTLTSMGLNRKFIRWISNFLDQRKLIISINNQLHDSIRGLPQGSPLSQYHAIFYASDITKPTHH